MLLQSELLYITKSLSERNTKASNIKICIVQSMLPTKGRLGSNLFSMPFFFISFDILLCHLSSYPNPITPSTLPYHSASTCCNSVSVPGLRIWFCSLSVRSPFAWRLSYPALIPDTLIPDTWYLIPDTDTWYLDESWNIRRKISASTNNPRSTREMIYDIYDISSDHCNPSSLMSRKI